MKNFTNEDSFREEVEKTMKSLDQIERIDVSPFFVSKVFTRIESRNNVSPYSSVWFKVALASMAVFILINIYTILINIKEDVAGDDSKVTFIEEYEITKYQDEYSY